MAKRPPRGRGDAKASIAGATRRIRKRGHASVAAPGVPNAVGRPQGGGKRRPAAAGGDDLRVVWLLDMLAHARWGQLAPRPDPRGVRAPMPPIVLPHVEAGAQRVAPSPAPSAAPNAAPNAAPSAESTATTSAESTAAAPAALVVALDPLDAIARLRSRKRAFSQIAGRYSALLVGARDVGAGLHITWWNIGGDAHALSPAVDDDAWAASLADQLVSYLSESGVPVQLERLGPDDARRLLDAASDIPETLAARNPLAWWRAS